MASSMLFAASPFILKHGDSYQQSNVNAMQITDMWWKQKFFYMWFLSVIYWHFRMIKWIFPTLHHIERYVIIIYTHHSIYIQHKYFIIETSSILLFSGKTQNTRKLNNSLIDKEIATVFVR
jgi:hypothetical protein